MIERTTVMGALLLGVALVVAALWMVGWRSRKPPGKQGIKGTGLENSAALYPLQMARLTILLVACGVAAAWLLWR